MDVLFERYEVIREIGRGARGKVLLVRDINLDRMLAMKIQPDYTDCENEVSFLKKLRHAGFPEVFDFYRVCNEETKENMVYIIMEYIEGITLDKFLKENGPLSESRMLGIIFRIMEILEYLHNFKPSIVYMDLKPENIMICDGDEIRIIDLGALYQKSYVNYKRDFSFGTRGYSAPELWSSTDIDTRADIYSIGILMCVMLTNADPSVAISLKSELYSLDSKISENTLECIVRCMSIVPGNRYENIAELRKALNRKHRTNFSKIKFTCINAASVLCYVFCIASIIITLIKKDRNDYNVMSSIVVLVGSYILSVWANRCARKNITIKKKIWLTQKKNIGLYLLLFGLFLSGVMHIVSNTGYDKVYAVASRQKMWVNLMDEKGKMVLIKDGAVYESNGGITFEIPKEQLPKKELYVSINVLDEDGNLFESRSFGVKNKSI